MEVQMKTSEHLELADPTLELESTFLEMMEDYREHGETLPQFTGVDPVLEFRKFVHLLKQHAIGKELPQGFVPSVTWWLVRDKKDIVGTIRLRLGTYPFLEKEGGYIGYDVRPSERRKGYGTRILSLGLEKTRGRGMERILITCDSDNVGSRRIIEKNGGEFESEVVSDVTGKTKLRFWISLK
jgi:predicted acetyltransferase